VALRLAMGADAAVAGNAFFLGRPFTAFDIAVTANAAADGCAVEPACACAIGPGDGAAVESNALLASSSSSLGSSSSSLPGGSVLPVESKGPSLSSEGPPIRLTIFYLTKGPIRKGAHPETERQRYRTHFIVVVAVLRLAVFGVAQQDCVHVGAGVLVELQGEGRCYRSCFSRPQRSTLLLFEKMTRPIWQSHSVLSS